MPLHISLGFCLKVLNTTEEIAIAIDNEIKSVQTPILKPPD